MTNNITNTSVNKPQKIHHVRTLAASGDELIAMMFPPFATEGDELIAMMTSPLHHVTIATAEFHEQDSYGDNEGDESTTTAEFHEQEIDSEDDELIPMMTSPPHYIRLATAELLAQEDDDEFNGSIIEHSAESSSWSSLPPRHSTTEYLDPEDDFYSDLDLDETHTPPEARHAFPTNGNAQEEDFGITPNLATHNAPQAQYNTNSRY